MTVLILCGGRGMRLLDEPSYIPKGMVRLGHRPILWHIMKRFALAGYTDFVLALGKRGEMIRDYFLNYNRLANDARVLLGSGEVEMLTQHQEEKWRITFVDTGENANSGARIHRCKRYLGGNEFFITYADTLGDIDISELVAFHRSSKKVLTLTGVVPPYREGEFLVEGRTVIGLYDAKEDKQSKRLRFVNGGYMVANKNLFSYLNAFSECKLETDVFSLLIKDEQLSIYPHYGFWRWLDTDRDYLYLQELVDKNQMYWLQKKG